MIAEGRSHPDIAGLTNDDGRFRLTGLAPGKYKIEVDADGSSLPAEACAFSAKARYPTASCWSRLSPKMMMTSSLCRK